MSRIIGNLASNATRYAHHKVTFAVAETNGSVILRVADDGPGVPEDKRLLVFERFRRLDGDRGRAKGGSGLGLAIVSELASKYSGTVWVEETPGGGACFVVVLPTSSSEVR